MSEREIYFVFFLLRREESKWVYLLCVDFWRETSWREESYFCAGKSVKGLENLRPIKPTIVMYSYYDFFFFFEHSIPTMIITEIYVWDGFNSELNPFSQFYFNRFNLKNHLNRFYVVDI